MKILVLNGPNLNMLGIREPGIYGSNTFADLLALIDKTALEEGLDIEQYQSNHEGDLVATMAKEGLSPAGTYNNLAHFGERVKFGSHLTDEDEDMIFDPQTSGGLLFAVAEKDADELLNRLDDMGVPASPVAEVYEYDGEANIQVV